MTLLDWFPTLAPSVILALVIWLSRNLIITRLTKSVEHEFNIKLERLQADIREADERFKADLKAKEVEISSLRSGALTSLANRHIALDKRRLEAVDQLWAAFNTFNSARVLSSILSKVDFDEAARNAEHNPETRKAFENISETFDLKSYDIESGIKARPFVSEMTWAAYIAFTSICGHAVLRLTVLRMGVGAYRILTS